MPSEKRSKMALPVCTQCSYSVGHVQNDLCASMWFSYLLIFLTAVLGCSSRVAGLLMLIGQIADALATPVVGYCSDRGGIICCCGYGRRKSWHLLGTVCVTASFPFVFSECFIPQFNDAVWTKVLYYSIFICIFQFGWASVQISNLSVVPELTPDEHERTALLAYRYSFTVISNMAVYVITFIALRLNGASQDHVGPKQLHTFEYVAIIVLSMGVLTSLIYHFGVKERNRNDPILGSGDDEFYQKTSCVDLFKHINLYKVALVYMATRLFVNMSQVIIPLYLQYYLRLPAESLAIVPFIVFTSSFITSLIIKPLNQKFGRKIAYSIGAFLGVGAATMVFFGEGDVYRHYLVYVDAALFGCAGSIMLVTSLGVTSDHIGQDLDNGAFIYGIMSFSDKVSNGAVIMVIQEMECATCLTHYRDSLSFVCGAAAILGFLGILSFRHFKREDNYIQNDNAGFEADIPCAIEDQPQSSSSISVIVPSEHRKRISESQSSKES